MESQEGKVAAFNSAMNIIKQWLPKKQSIFDEDDRADEKNEYLKAVDVIQASMDWAAMDDHYQDMAQTAIRIAVLRLEHEFVNILKGNRSGSTPRSSNHSSSLSDSSFSSFEFYEEDHCHSSFTEAAINNLQSVTETMDSIGRLLRCVEAYVSTRGAVVDLCFRQLFEIEKLSGLDIQRLEVESFVLKTKQWIRAAKVCFRSLFVKEKQLCEQIFGGIGTDFAYACFADTVKVCVDQLLNFVGSVTMGRPLPDRLFNILDLRQALEEILPDIEVLFQSNSWASVGFRAAELLPRLQDSIRNVLFEFENVLTHELDLSIIPAPGGTVHDLTIYVMKYVARLSNYELALDKLILSKPNLELSGHDLDFLDMDFEELGMLQTPFSAHLTWIIKILQARLQIKSKKYNNVALAHLFMMNNVNHILKEIKKYPALTRTVGDDFLKKLAAKILQETTSYRRTVWLRVLNCLEYSGRIPIAKRVLKERINNFNTMFEDVHRTQSIWLVPDLELRFELHVSIMQVVVPAYRQFLGRHGSIIIEYQPSKKYLKYTDEYLERAIEDLFQGRESVSQICM